MNAFTELPANVILYMRYVRRALDRYGDRSTPLLATELSFPSAVGRSDGSYDFDTTEAGQARGHRGAAADARRRLPLAGHHGL